MKRKLLREAPTQEQVRGFTEVLTKLFGDDCQLGVKIGHAATALIFYSHRDNKFFSVNALNGKVDSLGEMRPRMFEPIMQGAQSISYALLGNAESDPRLGVSLKGLFKAAGQEKDFDTNFAVSKQVPMTMDERDELMRLRKENEELKKKVAELQGKAYGIPRGPAATSASGYSGLEID